MNTDGRYRIFVGENICDLGENIPIAWRTHNDFGWLFRFRSMLSAIGSVGSSRLPDFDENIQLNQNRQAVNNH